MRLTIFFLLLSSIGFAQSKFTGYQKQFLDSMLCPTDSVGASYFGYSYINNGKPLFEFKCSKKQRQLRVSFSERSSKPITAISGKVEFKDIEGTLIESHTYRDGQPVKIKTFNYGADKSSFWIELFHFDSLYQNTPGTYFYETMNDFGVLVSQGWFREGEQGWRVYELEEWKDVHMVQDDNEYKVIKETKDDYKYPYFGENIPPYIGFVLGYEGIVFGSLVGGVSFNLVDAYFPRKTGNMLGGSLMYRYNLPSSTPDTTGLGLPTDIYLGNYWGLRAEFGNYSVVSYSLGYDLFVGGGYVTHAVTPMIGTSLYNAQLLFSYAIHSIDHNRIGKLRGWRINLRYVIPLPRKNYTPKNMR